MFLIVGVVAVLTAAETDEELHERFKKIKVLAEDCVPEKTQKTIDFLAKSQAEISKIKDDESRSLINIALLRRFMKRKGFLKVPGSIHFINGLDTTLILDVR